jgi:transposase
LAEQACSAGRFPADDLSSTGFAEAIVVADPDAPRSGSGPALVVDLGRGRRVTIYPGPSAVLVAAALKALR